MILAVDGWRVFDVGTSMAFSHTSGHRFGEDNRGLECYMRSPQCYHCVSIRCYAM